MSECTVFQSNDCDIIFSLILATYNRKDDVEQFILSLTNQKFYVSKFELIIIDQNADNFLLEIVEKYKRSLNIQYFRSDILGPSINRNIGIKMAKGKIIAFPDDDCTFYKDTLFEVYNIFSEQDNITTVLGQIFDQETGQKIIRKWPDKVKKVTVENYFYLYSCITVFTKNKKVLFDSRLGPNTDFGAYEDADYIFALVSQSKDDFYYFPSIKVNHPQLNMSTMDLNKISNYGLGFGAFCKKNLSWNMLILFGGAVSYHTVMLLVAIMKLDPFEVKKRYFSISYRLKGFLFFDN